jgi:hypothetical protein
MAHEAAEMMVALLFLAGCLIVGAVLALVLGKR